MFKKIGDIKGTFCAKMDMIKDKNGRDLTEAEHFLVIFYALVRDMNQELPIPQ